MPSARAALFPDETWQTLAAWEAAWDRELAGWKAR